MQTEYAEAISKGVQNWLDANRDSILLLIRTAIEPEINTSMGDLARSMNKKVSSFFDDNKEEMIATMAAAVACMWDIKNRPPAGGST